MKNYIIILLSLMILWSCEDVLDKPPLDTITDKEITFSKKEMELYANKFYGNFPTHEGYWLGIFEMDNSSDNMVSGDYNYNAQLAGTIQVPGSGGGWDFSKVRSANFFLENYHKTEEELSTVSAYIGEMYFWRAWFYFDLVKTFGDVPWYSKTLTTESEELYAPRTPRNAVVDSILVDLDQAIALLPEKGQETEGRIYREIALLFQSRVALYEGTWEKYHNGTDFGVDNADWDKYFRKAAEAANQVITSGHFAIDKAGTSPSEHYWGLFNQEDYSNSQEIMLWKKWDLSLNLYHLASAFFGVSDKNTGISKSLVNSYLCTDGKPIAVSDLYLGDDLIDEELSNRDPRLAQTIFVRGDVRNISGTDTSFFSVPDLTLEARLRNTTGYQLAKGNNPTADRTSNQDITGSIIFRYAEVLLNYAEAKAELNECTQSVLDESVNLLRDRVDMPHLTVDPGFDEGVSKTFPQLSQLMNEIRRERRVELACEGYRFDDLMRWAAADIIQRPMLGAKIQQYADIKDEFRPVLVPEALFSKNGYIAPYENSPAKDGWQFNPNKNYLKPLPSNQLTLNPNLEQNPGY
ncbi:RagB/SusD family nutrient uptake outer membrane protein [Sunxiuqinia rutila]|uniref:RagB/SusD family nutrient uptake outer membrane protein n=1 Tax=Sunxiuqinia rutila TaxID=1397841 RepID=UPI003D362AEE